MKKITSVVILAFMLYFTACKPAALNEYESYSGANVAAYAGTWKLSKVVQYDEDSKRKLFPYRMLDLTNTMNLTDIKLTLNTTNGAPSGLSINYGSAPRMFNINSGTWLLDNPTKPGQLWFANATDTTKFVLSAYSKIANNVLALRQIKKLGSTEMVSYEYEFSKN